jgi:hypothetical protein
MLSFISIGLLAGAGVLWGMLQYKDYGLLDGLMSLRHGADLGTVRERTRYRGSRKAKSALRRLRAARYVLSCARGTRYRRAYVIGEPFKRDPFSVLWALMVRWPESVEHVTGPRWGWPFPMPFGLGLRAVE